MAGKSWQPSFEPQRPKRKRRDPDILERGREGWMIMKICLTANEFKELLTLLG